MAITMGLLLHHEHTDTGIEPDGLVWRIMSLDWTYLPAFVALQRKHRLVDTVCIQPARDILPDELLVSHLFQAGVDVGIKHIRMEAEASERDIVHARNTGAVSISATSTEKPITRGAKGRVHDPFSKRIGVPGR